MTWEKTVLIAKSLLPVPITTGQKGLKFRNKGALAKYFFNIFQAI
jgi:hypothetical protein